MYGFRGYSRHGQVTERSCPVPPTAGLRGSYTAKGRLRELQATKIGLIPGKFRSEKAGNRLHRRRCVLAGDFQLQLGPFRGEKRENRQNIPAICPHIAIDQLDLRFEFSATLGNKARWAHVQAVGIGDDYLA